LPRAFAVADLRGVVGWKARIEAAERLAQTAALSENRLLGIYSERKPAASGGIWDRVEAIQRLDRALSDRDASAVARALPNAWRAMQAARLEVPFARLIASRLDALPLPAEVSGLAHDIALLSPDYERVAQRQSDPSFATTVALGQPSSRLSRSAMEQAIVKGFADTSLPGDTTLALSQGRIGEAILDAMQLYENAMSGETKDMVAALATFRRLGLEDTARQAALQALFLSRGP
jgi:hypothetical protein